MSVEYPLTLENISFDNGDSNNNVHTASGTPCAGNWGGSEESTVSQVDENGSVLQTLFVGMNHLIETGDEDEAEDYENDEEDDDDEDDEDDEE
jgi:hypothetical protein